MSSNSGETSIDTPELWIVPGSEKAVPYTDIPPVDSGLDSQKEVIVLNTEKLTYIDVVSTTIEHDSLISDEFEDNVEDVNSGIVTTLREFAAVDADSFNSRESIINFLIDEDVVPKVVDAILGNVNSKEAEFDNLFGELALSKLKDVELPKDLAYQDFSAMIDVSQPKKCAIYFKGKDASETDSRGVYEDFDWWLIIPIEPVGDYHEATFLLSKNGDLFSECSTETSENYGFRGQKTSFEFNPEDKQSKLYVAIFQKAMTLLADTIEQIAANKQETQK